jgi:hypothetical protein
MPPTKQRKHFVLAESQESAQPVMDALLANGMLPDNVRWLDYSGELRRFKPDDVAFIFLPDFKYHPRYLDCSVRVHGMIALGAIVKPIPQTRLEKIAEDISCTEPADHKTLQRITDGYGQLWEMIFNDVVSDKVGEKSSSTLRQAAERAVDMIDAPRCDCYYCRALLLTGDDATSEYRLDDVSNSAESAPEELIEYLQVFLGGLYHGTKSSQISIVPGTEFFFTDENGFTETYRLTDHSVLGKLMYFWIQVDEWDDRQRLVREYLLEPLES